MNESLTLGRQHIESAARQKKGNTKPRPDAIQVEQLYTAHCAALKAFLMRRTRSEEVVEVLLQEIYLRLMEIKDLSVIDQPGAYLNRLAYHLWVDHRRRHQLEQKYFDPEDPDEIDNPIHSVCISPVPDEIHYAQVWSAYDQLLRQLPPPAREVLLLYKLEGYTHTEIAHKLGISKSWVEKLIAKTILYCREHGPDIDF